MDKIEEEVTMLLQQKTMEREKPELIYTGKKSIFQKKSVFQRIKSWFVPNKVVEFPLGPPLDSTNAFITDLDLLLEIRRGKKSLSESTKAKNP